MILDKNILVTGATGFVAYNLVKKLCVNNQIYCIVRKSSDISRLKKLSNIHFIIYDGSLPNLYEQLQSVKIDITYHLASLFIAEHITSQVDDLILSNILFPIQLVEILASLGYTKFINTGTVWQNYLGEEYNPVCLYAATKEAFEDILKYYNQVKNFSCITLRLYDTYGKGDWRKKLFWVLTNLQNSTQSIDMSSGQQKLNLVYIDDVVRAFETAGERLLGEMRILNEVYGVYDDAEYSLCDIVTIFEQTNKCKLNVNWGKRAPRVREIISPPKVYPPIPSWKCTIKLSEGIKLLNKLSTC